jgi:hypothetical protein
MATKRYLEILETVKKNNPVFYEKLMKEQETTKLQASRAPKPRAKSQPTDGITQEMIDAVRALDEPGENKTASTDADYVGLIRSVMDKDKCDVFSAMKKVDKTVPHARSDFVKKANQQPDPENQGNYDEAEISTFMQQVKEYQVTHKCSYSEALKATEILKPGIRAAYIRKSNQ